MGMFVELGRIMFRMIWLSRRVGLKTAADRICSDLTISISLCRYRLEVVILLFDEPKKLSHSRGV